MCIERVPEARIERRMAELANAGVRVFALPRGIEDKGGFFDAVQRVFPLDPLLTRRSDKWDALADSLSGGLMDLPETRLAVVWLDSRDMACAQPQAFEIALSIFTQAGDELARLGREFGGPKQLLVLLAD